MPETRFSSVESSPAPSAQSGFLAASGTDFAALLDASPDAIITLDRDFRITYANPQALHVSQLEPARSIGKIYWDIRPESRGTLLEENFRIAMRDRVSRRFEFYCASIDLWTDVLVTPFADGVAVFYKDISVAKLARRTRDAATTRLQQTFDATPDSIVCLDYDWNFTFANWRAVDMFASGYLIGENFWHCLHHSMQEPFSSNYRKAMEQRIPTEFEAHYPAPVNLWLNIQCIPSDDGIIVFFRNITERRQSEEALRESEARYRLLTELNPQAIWTAAANGEITYANQGFSDYLGFTTADLDHWMTAIDPKDRARVLDAWTDCVTSGNEFDIEGRLIRARDGVSRWWWIRARPIRDSSGTVLYWLGVAIDIDDRKTFAETLLQKQAETERQRAELETIYDTAPVGLALFDPVEFRYLRVNDHQAAVIGLPKDKILGRSILEIAPLEGLKELFQQVAAGNTVRNHILEGELPTRPGQHRFWSVNYSPVYAADGKIEAIAAVVVEITHQKKAENALIQSEKLAAVGRLASSISHEINNPLEAITNLLYLMALSDELPQGVRAYVQTAQSELSRVCQIATQTLRFHRQAVRASHVSAAQLVDAVLNLYQGRLVNSDIRVQACYSTSTRILCFENDIRQVLNNLIANAIDAMRQGGRLLVRAHDATDHSESSAKGRHGIRITIADTGHGMSPEVRTRLFEPFYTTKDLNGTGLGLWISAGIVRRHQGRLSFRSTQHPIHHGTIFSLFLPWAEEPSPPISESPLT